ncbi:hypothetical protein ESOMN_v1c03530 [Williamsoniiplasma somnilux]|uniref:Probable membrane transporter protein n=1 Tax=Williamsoniiplasma somnilux TaxID=215578 RepID=A0A2K8NY27_9MOLU|nr:sulfite exporter TauE/SafE family protein [Williamsoniiplasma somnilux]ATZ18735.1 hypothetical protein ESOMN_v1c03530 [Williamsoniiplasma somnilux]
MEIGLLIPLLIIITLVISVLGSLSGVGGGVLFLPLFLLLLVNNNFQEIKLLSTILVFTSSLINTCINFYKKQYNYLIFLNVIIFAIPGVFLGNYLETLINPKWVQFLIALLLLMVSIILILQMYVIKPNQKKEPIAKYNWIYIVQNQQKINCLQLSLIIFLAGILTSLTGIGGGPIIMPILLIWLKLNLKVSVPISHSIIAVTSLITLITNYKVIGNYQIDWLTVVLPTIIGVIIGTLSAIYFKKYFKKDNYLRWILISLILGSSVKMFVDFAISF